MMSYQKHNDGVLTDYVPSDEEIQKALALLPKM
jgi:tryptophan synthase beta chain